MLAIRFLRVGKKNQPFYRVVVTDKKNPPRAGRFLEILGFVNPFTKEKKLKAERIKYWLSVGAKTSKTVHNLLVEQGIIEGKKIPVHKKPKKKESAPATENPAANKANEPAVEPVPSPASEATAAEPIPAPEQAPEPAPMPEKTE